MPWRNAHALHIFVPNTQAHENWVEQILGTVVRPLIKRFDESIRWMWVTRYVQIGEKLPEAVKTYSADNPIPVHFLFQGQTYYRYIVFRINTTDTERAEIHQMALELADKNKYYVVPWVDYDVIGDLGNNRFIHANAGPEERVVRARLVANFVDATVRLMLDSLVEDAGQWRPETNSDVDNNPDGSFFQSMYHLFCNATDSPMHIEVRVTSPYSQATWKVPVKF